MGAHDGEQTSKYSWTGLPCRPHVQEMQDLLNRIHLVERGLQSVDEVPKSAELRLLGHSGQCALSLTLPRLEQRTLSDLLPDACSTTDLTGLPPHANGMLRSRSPSPKAPA
jgi:hypothetical protein